MKPRQDPPTKQTRDAALFEIMARRTLDYAIFLLDENGHIMSWNEDSRRSCPACRYARHLRGKARTPRPLLVAVTGWGKTEDIRRSQDAGFDIHLVKPGDEAQILDIIADRSRWVR